MTDTTLDHLVVAARRLDEGMRHVRDALGVDPVAGGHHPDMGTHNALLRLGPSTYLEVIAVDPDAAAPGTRRWFDLDGEATRAALAERPRLLTWVARTRDLDRTVARCPWDTGPVRPMRRGDLAWRIAFPGDGRLLEGGLLPPLIEWAGDAAHPASRLPETGCTLVSLRGLHPEGGHVKEMLAAIDLGDALEVHHARGGGPPRLEAEIDTPGGVRILG